MFPLFLPFLVLSAKREDVLIHWCFLFFFCFSFSVMVQKEHDVKRGERNWPQSVIFK